jgi:hypothetical protein
MAGTAVKRAAEEQVDVEQVDEERVNWKKWDQQKAE